MSKIYKTIEQESVIGFSCDGPSHPGETYMQFDPYEVLGGYGSTLHDMETFHFCGLTCLADWALAEKKKEKPT